MRPLRTIIAALVLVGIVWLAFQFYDPRAEAQAQACIERVKPTMGDGTALADARAIVACLDNEAGWGTKRMMHYQRKYVMSDAPAPCRYVGVWRMRRGSNLEYRVRLQADRRFEAIPVTAPDKKAIAGTWIVEDGRITWLYDRMPVWPPDSNPVADHGENAFSMGELGGASTHYELLERLPAQGCAA